MKIYLVRHGYAYHNELYSKIGEKAYFDKSIEDAELTNLGISQAKNIGELLKDVIFSDYYSSPSIRCIQTLNNLIDSHGITVNLDDRLLEPQGFHICNKRKNKNILEEKIKLFGKKYNLNKVNNKYFFNLELNNTINRRIIDFIEEIKSKYINTNKNILIVTHHDWINHFYKIYFNKNISFDNCQYEIINF